MHKEKFCKKFGLPLSGYSEVDFENVVRVFNPSLAKEDVNNFETPQKTLYNFGMKKW